MVRETTTGSQVRDCKAVANLSNYPGGAGYKEHLGNYINAMEQARPGMGELVRNSCRFAVATTSKNFGYTEFATCKLTTECEAYRR